MERNLVYDGINLLFSIWYIKFKSSILIIVYYLVILY